MRDESGAGVSRRRRAAGFAAALTFALLAAAVALPARALDVPPAPTQWYTDAAGLLDASQAEALNAKLRDFEQQSGAQFIIYVFDSLDGEAMEDFTIRCAEKWKVGNKKYDNGLILFVFAKDRKIRVEVGYGLEPTITDAFSSDVIRNYIAPKFRSGDYAAGLNAGADAVIAKIRGEEPPHPPVQRAQRATDGNVNGIPCSFLMFAAIIFFLIVLPRLMGRRRGGCNGCFWPMLFFPGGGGTTFGGGGFSGGGGGGFGGFSGGGGSFGGGGASGGW